MRSAFALWLMPFALAAQIVVSGSGRVGTPGLPAAPQAQPTKPEDLCTIEGHIYNAVTGAPLKKATVVVMRADGGPNSQPPQSFSTGTDSAGKFAMKDIEPGKYRMTVTRNGFVTATYGARGRYGGNTARNGSRPGVGVRCVRLRRANLHPLSRRRGEGRRRLVLGDPWHGG